MKNKLPLSGYRIINTRTRTQASELSKMFIALGAQVLEIPTIEICFVDEKSELSQKLENLDYYDWIIFTSTNGVHSFFSLFTLKKLDSSLLHSCNIASVGKGTTQLLQSYAITVDVTAQNSFSEGLVDCLKDKGPWRGKKVLLPIAEKNRGIIQNSLHLWGACVHEVTAYKTILPMQYDASIVDCVLTNRYDIITFTSSSTCRNFLALIGKENTKKIKRTLRAASIGPITTATMKSLGLKPLVESRQSNLPSFVQSITDYLITAGSARTLD